MEYLLENSGLVIDKTTAILIAVVVSLLAVVKSILELWASKWNISGTKISSMKEQLEMEKSYSDKRDAFKEKYKTFTNETALLAGGTIDEAAVRNVYDKFIEFLSDYSYYVIQYSFIQKNGFKNKIGLSVLRGDVYDCIESYLVLYDLCQSPELKGRFAFSFSQIKALYLFVSNGARGTLRTHIAHRKILKAKKVDKNK